jgi:hypothetical protein
MRFAATVSFGAAVSEVEHYARVEVADPLEVEEAIDRYLTCVEPYPGLPDTYTVPFRGGLLIHVVPPGRRVVGMVAMVGVEQ